MRFLKTGYVIPAMLQSMWTHRFGGPRRFGAKELADVYRRHSMSTLEKSVNRSEAELGSGRR